VPWQGKTYDGYAFSHQGGLRVGKVSETKNGLRLFIEGRYESYADMREALVQIAKGLPKEG